MKETVKTVMLTYGFKWDPTEELWVKSHGFGRKSTVDNIFGKLFIIKRNKEILYDHFIDTFAQFKEIINKHFGPITEKP